MSRSDTIYLHVWTGTPAKARDLVLTMRPGCTLVELSHRELRSKGWRGQLRAMRSLKGQALVVFFKSLNDSPHVPLVRWTGVAHRCQETIIADEQGSFEVYRRSDLVRLLPRTFLSCVVDGAIFSASWILLRLWKVFASPVPLRRTGSSTIAYLFPYPLMRDVAGGALSHVRGVLEGIAASGVSCQVFSGVPLNNVSASVVAIERQYMLFWEALILRYNLHFSRAVQRRLCKTLPRLIYQRHGRFTIAGALLSRTLKIPLVLEYNGSEVWVAKYWDPSRFLTWLRLCEEVSLACASLIVVVAEPMREELLERGIRVDRILVNPNAVDPTRFRPGCGGTEVRRTLGVLPGEVLVGFVGTFGPWHGIQVLQLTIDKLLQMQQPLPLRFLLVGDGVFHSETKDLLRAHIETGKVIMTGMVAQDHIAEYLDATDILVAPHVRMPDGRRFFGSPTKLFEYMAMGKAIVASNLDQLGEVLTHNETALLIEPGDWAALFDAITLLAQNEPLRRRLGERARATAVASHTWQHNAAKLLTRVGFEINAHDISSVLEQHAS